MIQFERLNHKLVSEIQVIEDGLYVSRTVTIDQDDYNLQNTELEHQKKSLKDKMNEVKSRFEDA